MKMIRPVTFMNKGQQLVGILHVPDRLEAAGSAPGIVMFHGFTGHKSETHRLFVTIAAAGPTDQHRKTRSKFRSGRAQGQPSHYRGYSGNL